jgi:hypothetical protein
MINIIRFGSKLINRYGVQILTRYRRITPGKKHALPAPLIVSLTSYPPRFPTLHLTIRSILNQRTAPDIVILWVSYEDFEKLPKAVKDLCAYGLEIRQCKDIKSYKKIIPTLKLYQNSYILIADDDAFYENNWIKELTDAAKSTSNVVFAHRAHRIEYLDGLFSPYRKWVKNIHPDPCPSIMVFPTGVGGVLYPPRIFHRDVLLEENFMKLCPTGDDIWLYWMAALNGATFAKVGKRRDVITWPGSQKLGLHIFNTLDSEENDKQIQSMIKAYGVPFE